MQDVAASVDTTTEGEQEDAIDDYLGLPGDSGGETEGSFDDELAWTGGEWGTWYEESVAMWDPAAEGTGGWCEASDEPMCTYVD